MPLVATLPLELSNALLSKCWDKTVAPIARDDLGTYFNVKLRDSSEIKFYLQKWMC